MWKTRHCETTKATSIECVTNIYFFFSANYLLSYNQSKNVRMHVCVRLYVIVVLEWNNVVFSFHSLLHEMSTHNNCLFTVFSIQCVLHEATH